MRKTKAKRDSFWRSQMLPFVLVWTISVGIVNVISRIWPWQVFSLGAEVEVTLTLLLTVMLSGAFQVFLVERLLKRSMRGWMLYTIPAALIALLLNNVLPPIFFGSNPFLRSIFNDNYGLLTSLALNAPAPLLQFFWLRRRVKHAWIWPLISIPFLLAITAIPYGQSVQILKMVLMLSVGVVQAGLMHYFWQYPKDENTRLDFATDEELDEGERIERLQEHERANGLWERGDDQALQSEA